MSKDTTLNTKAAARLRIFASFEDAAMADAEDTLKQLPLERIRETVELILRIYGVTREQLNSREKSNRMRITQYS